MDQTGLAKWTLSNDNMNKVIKSILISLLFIVVIPSVLYFASLVVLINSDRAYLSEECGASIGLSVPEECSRILNEKHKNRESCGSLECNRYADDYSSSVKGAVISFGITLLCSTAIFILIKKVN